MMYSFAQIAKSALTCAHAHFLLVTTPSPKMHLDKKRWKLHEHWFSSIENPTRNSNLIVVWGENAFFGHFWFRVVFLFVKDVKSHVREHLSSASKSAPNSLSAAIFQKSSSSVKRRCWTTIPNSTAGRRKYPNIKIIGVHRAVLGQLGYVLPQIVSGMPPGR